MPRVVHCHPYHLQKTNDTMFPQTPGTKNGQKFLCSLLQNAAGFYKVISTRYY